MSEKKYAVIEIVTSVKSKYAIEIVDENVDYYIQYKKSGGEKISETLLGQNLSGISIVNEKDLK